MNLVGKIFVVLILVMSLVFMAMAMAVYATHRNYRDIILGGNGQVGLAEKLQNEENNSKVLKDEKEKLTKEIDTIKLTDKNALTKLETENKMLEEARVRLEREKADLEKEKREAVVAMNATQKAAADYRQQLETQRAAVLAAQQDRDAQFKQVVELTDKLHQLANDKELLRKRMADLSKDLAKNKEALDYFHINPNSDYKSTTPPQVDGVVLAVQGGGLIEISLGSDAGLRKGHQLEVERISGGASTYVGKVEVVETTPDRSVCKFLPGYQNSNVMKGDRVESKIHQ